MTDPLFHVVLHEPEIPNNTGNIGRTCVATGCGLHLIRPLGFSTSEKALRRAGLDYWARLGVREHDSLDDCLLGLGANVGEREPVAREPEPMGRDRGVPRVWAFTTKASRPAWEARFGRGDVFLFGKETAGLPDAILGRFSANLVTFPMLAGERSLNLATAVCAAVYEGVRQLVGRAELGLTETGRIAQTPRVL